MSLDPAGGQTEALATEIEKLTPADKLRLAAGFIERGQHRIAEVLTKRVADELTYVRLFGKGSK